MLEIQGINKSFGTKDNKTNVLSNVNFTVDKGEFVVIHGESGSGKSTLLNIMAGFEKPDKGEVLINGTDITKLNESKKAVFRRKHVGFVFQQYHLIPELSALENVMFPLILDKVSAREAKKKAAEILSYVGIDKNINNLPSQFSGGQNQRIAIARAMIAKPEILFADEPTGNLDSVNSEKILSLLKKVNRELGTVILMVTHSVREREVADRLIEIRDGVVQQN